MKKLLKTVQQFLTSLLASQRPRVYLVVIAVFVCLGIFAYTTIRSTSQFTDDYAEYAALAKLHQDAAFLLGAPNNPVRQKLNRILSDVLSAPINPAARLALAREGLVLTAETEKQLEAVSKAGEEVDASIAKMQVTMLNSLTSSQHVKEVIALAKRRSEIISDIRAYSYRADFELRRIFDRIIAEGGKLPDSYIVELNTAIPELEEQFNKRSSLYAELQRTGEEMQRKFDEGGGE